MFVLTTTAELLAHLKWRLNVVQEAICLEESRTKKRSRPVNPIDHGIMLGLEEAVVAIRDHIQQAEHAAQDAAEETRE